ncbi:MAG: SDR family oxidoreductase [Rhizorhabdus sp.]
MTNPFASLQDRVVIITGGGRGLGKVMALALVGEGAKVLITGARSSAEIEATVAEGEAIGRGAIAGMIADVADPSDCAAVVRRAEDLFGPVEVLVNNAARAPAEQNLAERPGERPAIWDMAYDGVIRMLMTNVGGIWAMAQAVAPGMVARGAGKIVNVSTSRRTMIHTASGIYGPCKAAVEASSRVWADELAGTGVTVNVLLPGGPADTALIPGIVGNRAAKFVAGKEAPGGEGFVSGGLLPPEIMGPPMLWLASDLSNGATGRRYVARDWDADLEPNAAAVRAESSRIEDPHVI